MADGLARTALELWFYREVERVSARRAALETTDLSVARGPVPRAEALRLRTRYSQALQRAGLGAAELDAIANDRAVASRFAVVMDQVLADTPGYVAVDHGDDARRPVGLNRAITELGSLGKQGCRPISPFDPRWSATHAMQAAGSRLRFTHGAQVADPGSADERTVWADPDAAARGSERQAEKILLLDREDSMGLSAMHPFLSEADMVVARRVLLARGLQPRRPEAVRRSVALLRELRQLGEEFELVQERPGQLAARLTRHDLVVRLAEPSDVDGRTSQEPFVGRVYGHGLAWRLSRARKTDAQGRTPVHVPTLAQTLYPLRSALGRPLGVETQGGHFDDRGSVMVQVGDDLYLRTETPSGVTRMLLPSFEPPETALLYLESTITSARDNLTAALDVHGLLRAHGEAVAAGTLAGDTDELDLAALGFVFSTDPAVAEAQHRFARALLEGRPEQEVEDLATSTVDDVLGTSRPRWTDAGERWFDPSLVARWADGEDSPLTTLRTLAAAVRAIPNMHPDQIRPLLQGDERAAVSFCDSLLTYDLRSARSGLDLPEGSVQRAALEAAEEVLAAHGLSDRELTIDINGVIAWSGQRVGHDGVFQPGYAVGFVGQVFEPDEHGALSTRFAGGENHLVVPGYRAVVLPQDAQSPEQTIEQRTRLLGYREEILARVRQQVTRDVVSPILRTMGSATNLNDVYRSLFDVRYPLDHLQRAQAEGSLELAEAALATQAGRVRYPEWISDTMYQAWALENGKGAWISDAVGWSELEATGYRNRTVLSPESDGYFDPMMTTDSAPGVSRFLVEGTSIDAEGRIIPGDLAARAPVAGLPGLQFCEFDAFDRQRMTLMNLLTASRVTDPVMVAQVPLAGWTMEDGMVVSSEFAQRQRILDTDGSLRPLQVGDKLSDLHGNKGVVAQVVDRWRFMDGADPLLDAATQLFADNCNLDVVMSPFGALSRFNGGIPREAAGHTAALVGPAGVPLPSGAEMGALRMVVTNKSVTAGTRIYAEAEAELDEFGEPIDTAIEADRPAQRSLGSQGRRVSGQLAWALQSQGCDAVMNELYRNNGAAIDDLSEYAGLVGLGVDELGRLHPQRVGIEDRRVIDIEPLRDAKGRLQRRFTREAFSEAIAIGGGDLLLPFDLELPDPDPDAPRRGLQPGPRPGTWRLPVLSAHLRKPVPGASNKGHEYSGIYERIFMAAADFTVRGDQGAQEKAQREFSTLAAKVIQREFEGRHNIFRDSLMVARQPRSATAVWTADPRLDLDQLGVSEAMARQLGVSEGGHVLVWRDPVLRSSGVRYLRVVVDPALHGVSINPLLTKPFDGDFDGDSVGVVALPQPGPGASPEEARGGRYRAHREALGRLTVEANLVDRGVLKDSAELGYEVHPLAVHTGSDVAASGVDLGRFLARANDVDADLVMLREQSVLLADGHRSSSARSMEQEVLQHGRDLVAEMSVAVRESLVGLGQQYGLKYSSLEAHLDSIRTTCIETGAKGSERALADYSRYLGIDSEGHDTARPCPEGGVRAAAQGVNVALVVKKAVGIPGRISQRGVVALREVDLEAALELSYPCTQSQMQCKHDPASALQKYGLMQTAARDLWRGYLMDPSKGYQVVTDDKGQPEQASRQEWVDQALALYKDPQGLNIPDIDPQFLERAAAALVDGSGRMVNAESLLELSPEATAGQDGLTGAVAHSTALDRLSYQPSYAALLKEAQAGSRLFEGRQATFAPTLVRRNLDREQYEAGLEALFLGIAETAGPHDRKYDPARGPLVTRDEVQVVGSGRPAEVLERVGRRDVLAAGTAGARPVKGSRRLEQARRPVGVGAGVFEEIPSEPVEPSGLEL